MEKRRWGVRGVEEEYSHGIRKGGTIVSSMLVASEETRGWLSECLSWLVISVA